MPPPATANEFLDLVRKSRVLDEEKFLEAFPDDSDLPADPRECAFALVKADLLTQFQASQLLAGKFRGFVLGPYKLLKPLGRGGMGVVYLAEHRELGRKVALKILDEGKADVDDVVLGRFLREARAAAALDHPNIVRIFDVGQHGKVRYLVMEYVDGKTLEALLVKGGPMGLSRSVDYISQAAAGLQHAYEKGFIHRDIKPSNLMLTLDGTVKILDMGLARSLSDPKDKLTEQFEEEGAVMGTVDYMSPEQAVYGSRQDIRSDIYSLGATFFALVTGKPPFKGSTTQKLAQHQMKDAPVLADSDKTVPPGISAVVAKMLAKKPEDRFQSPADVITALAEWLPNSGTARVVAGLSNLDVAHSEKLRATLTTMTNGGSGRVKPGGPEGIKPKQLYWIIGGVAASVVALAIAVALIASGGGRDDRTLIASAGAAPPAEPAPVQAPPPAARPAYDRSQDRADGLVGYWKFDAPTTRTTKDESGLGGVGVIEGAVDWSKEDGRGALRFDGGFVRVADHPRLRFKRADSFTLAAWLNPPPELVNGAWQGVITKPRGRARGWYGIWLGNINGQRHWVYGSSFANDPLANTVGSRVIDDWQFVAIVQNAADGTRRVFVDGEDVTLDGNCWPAKDSDGPGDLLIGGATIGPANNEQVEPFRGAIAEVRLYSRALSAGELGQLAVAGETVEAALPLGPDGKPLNLDFEAGTLKDWTPEGDAFAEQPTEGDTVARTRPWMKMRSRHKGTFWIGGFEKRGDAPTGTLTSVAFKVTHAWASFLMGGGPSPDLAVELVAKDTGEVFHRSINSAEVEDMVRVWADLTEVKGKEIFIRLVDKHTGHWGHLNFDDFRFHAEKGK